MNTSRLVRRSASVVLLTVGAVLAATSQVQQYPSPSGDGIKAETAKAYADAHPYMDEAFPAIKKTIRELGGLKPAASQEQPTDLLVKVGAKADELLQKVPDLISDESVSQAQYAASQGMVPGCIGMDCLAGRAQFGLGRWFQLFNPDACSAGWTVGARGVPHRPKRQTSRGSENAKISRFCCGVDHFLFRESSGITLPLLRRAANGWTQYVCGWVCPDSWFGRVPGQIVSEGASVPMLLQGIAWVDQSDFRIVRLRTDLLAPRPEILFQRQTVNILFGPVQMPGLGLTLWLPQAVHAEMEANGQIVQEEHTYSKYRLYQTKSKVILGPSHGT